MTVIDETLRVRDDTGRMHERNPLGGDICLGCALPFPCVTANGGEQLHLDAMPWPRSFTPVGLALWGGHEVTHCQRMPDGRYAVSRFDASTVLADRDELVAAGVVP